MPLIATGSRLERIIMTSVLCHRFRGIHKHEVRRDISDTISRLEIDNPGLSQRIEDRLADSSYPGSKEQELVNLAIASVIGDGPIARKSDKAEAYKTHLLNSEGQRGRRADRVTPFEFAEWKRHQLRALMTAIDELPARSRAILQIVYFEGMSQIEAAERLSMRRSTLNDDLQKAIRSLRVRMEPLRAQEMDG